MKDIKYQCCFCGETITENPVYISISLNDTKQELYTHKKCLESKLAKNIPLHPDL